MSIKMTRRALIGSGAATAAALGFAPRAVFASDRLNAEALVDECYYTLAKHLEDPEMPEMRRYLKWARGVMIFPELIKGGFIVGGEGGSGVFLAKNTENAWSPPAFYTLAAGSVGLQIGGQLSQAVLTIMNDDAVQAVLEDNFKLGGDISLAVGPLGKGMEASTTGNFDDDVYVWSKAQGLFGGVSLEGAGFFEKNSYNYAYYDSGEATPTAIVKEWRYFNPQSDRLRALLPTQPQPVSGTDETSSAAPVEPVEVEQVN